LFIGEAPGKSENILGFPFVGIAGQKMDEIIDRTLGASVTKGLTNLISCIPFDEERRQLEEPPDESVKACGSRLIEMVEIAKPELIICVGKHAKEWLDPELKASIKIDPKVPRIGIRHPAWILRQPTIHQDMETRKAVIAITDAVESYL
jgi:DNA polymerase